MAITLFNKVAIPVDNGSQAGPTATFANPPIASMVAGDLVFVVVTYRGTGSTITNLSTGGQTWTAGINTISAASATLSVRYFYCIFNGTWSSAPSFTVTTGTNGITAWMNVFRPSSGFAFDPTTVYSGTSQSFSAPASPFDVSVNQVSVGTLTGLLQITAACTDDDNTWTLQTAQQTLIGYTRNLQGQDSSIVMAYQLDGANLTTFRQATLGGDAGVSFQFSMNEKATGAKRNYAIIIQ